MADLSTNVRYIRGIGEQRAKSLSKLGIETLRDLIGWFPRRYDDRTQTKRIADLENGVFTYTAAEENELEKNNLRQIIAYFS